MPRRDFMCDTAMRRMVSLSGLRARALQVGTMSDSSVMYAVILFRRRRSISLWFSLEKREERRKTKLPTSREPQPHVNACTRPECNTQRCVRLVRRAASASHAGRARGTRNECKEERLHWTFSAGNPIASPAAGEGDEPGKASSRKKLPRRFHNPRDFSRGYGLRSQRGVRLAPLRKSAFKQRCCRLRRPEDELIPPPVTFRTRACLR